MLIFKELWTKIGDGNFSELYIYRAKVPGGWLLAAHKKDRNWTGTNFIPDPEHKWDGSSLD